LDSSLYNCLVINNSSADYGGGVRFGVVSAGGGIYNCTVVSNTATVSGGGVSTGKIEAVANVASIYNSIIYFNTAGSGSNWNGMNGATNSCTAPMASGVGNITGDPMFVNIGAGNYRLAANSPCLDTGINYAWMLDALDVRSKDMDGRMRVRYGKVDMGAYELIHGGIFYGIR